MNQVSELVNLQETKLGDLSERAWETWYLQWRNGKYSNLKHIFKMWTKINSICEIWLLKN